MTAETFAYVRDTLAGQYVLERALGHGGMGEVYLAREVRLDRAVAVKVLPRHLAANPELRERFLREARTAAQLSHPHIVPIFRADEMEGFAFFTMAFVDGESLADRVRARGPLPVAEAVRLLRETAWALAYAHARGVVHRDVKPENIMIERGSNRAIVTDFGIARDMLAASLTQEGMVLGSAHYMSPEQASGDTMDGRSDLYSLGVVGFQILSGVRPFEGLEAASVMAQQVTRPAPSLSSVAPDLPSALVNVIDQCLLKQASERFQNGEALAEALQSALDSSLLPVTQRASEESVSTGHAHAIWSRAAQLQAEAGARLQERYRLEPGDSATSEALPTGGFRLRDVELAAAEAGIGAEYVAMAIAERPAPTAVVGTELSASQDRMLTRMLGTQARSISVTRVIRASPKVVLETIGRVFTQYPFTLTLQDTVGGHPLDGGIMVFEVPMYRTEQMMLNQRVLSPFSYRMTQVEVDRLNVILKPVAASGGACEVVVYGDLRKGLRKNWLVNKWISGSLAAGGALTGGLIGSLALSTAALAALPAIGSAAAIGGLSLMGYRAMYRHALRKANTELERMLAAIEGNLREVSVFGTEPGLQRLDHRVLGAGGGGSKT